MPLCWRKGFQTVSRMVSRGPKTVCAEAANMQSDRHPRHLLVQIITVAVLALAMTGMVTLAAARGPDNRAARLQSTVDNSICVALFDAEIINASGAVIDQPNLLGALSDLGLSFPDVAAIALSVTEGGCVGFVDTGTATDTTTVTDTAPPVPTIELGICLELFDKDVLNADGSSKITSTVTLTPILENFGIDPDLAGEVGVDSEVFEDRRERDGTGDLRAAVCVENIFVKQLQADAQLDCV